MNLLLAASLPVCIIVHDGDPAVRQHEVAHCWGWVHPQGEPNSTHHNPPPVPQKYLRKGEYPELVELVVPGRNWLTGRTNASRMCETVTAEDYHSTPFLMTVRGCATGGLGR